MVNCWFLVCGVATLLLLSGCSEKLDAPQPQPQYKLTMLPFPAVGISDNETMFGVIDSGRHNPASQQPHWETYRLAVWRNGQRRDLGALDGTDWCQPTAINSQGEVIGTFGPYALGPGDTEPDQYHQFIWNGQRLLDIGTTGVADGINSKGQVVGEKIWPDGQHGFLYFRGRTSEIRNPLSSEYSEVKAINDKGQMVGVAAGPRSRDQILGTVHALFWNNGVPYEMHLPEHSGFSIHGGPKAINNLGQVIINADDLDEPGAKSGIGTEIRCYIWHNGVVTDLGTLPGLSMSSIAINNQGQIIGNATKSNCSPQSDISHPFLWQSGQLYDLTCFPALKGWTNTRISGLNNRGQIVGYGTFKGVPRVFLLTPATTS